MHWAMFQSLGTGLGLPELNGDGGPGPDLGVEGHGMSSRASGARLTTNLELVRTRGI